MTTLTLDHLTPAQRAELRGPAPDRPANRFDDMAKRFLALATRARLADQPLAAQIHRGYAAIAADLAAMDLDQEIAA